ncbi:MAG TPA: M56 family metallopeptidase, partial [Steroidobacteraceae bacterium]
MISLVLEAVVRSMALGLTLWVALSLTRSRNPHLHKMLWSTVLLASLTIPFVMRAHVTPAIQAPDYVLTLRGDAGGMTHWSGAWSYVSVLYGSIALALILRYAYSLFQMWRIRRDARVLHEPWTCGSDVRVTAHISYPATFGSTILLPAGFTEWTAQKLRAVMAHEHSHVIHRDCYVLWLARLHISLFWINPLAWWMQRRLASLAEITSDEAAVAAVEDRAHYAEILLEFAQQRAASAVATAMTQPNISQRIDRILSGVAPSSIPRLFKRILVLAALLPAVAATAAPVASAPLRLAQRATESIKPSIKSGVGPDELEKYYPKEAMRRGIEGLVRIQVSLDAKGRPTDTLVLSEDPLEMGFGAAASTMVH